MSELNILVTDDDPVIRTMVARSLAGVCRKVLQAANGLEALASIERDDPDLLITDLRMPVMDGFEMIATLRRSDAWRSLPVILLTAADDRADVERLVGAGISAYVLKPVSPYELLARVKEVARATEGWRPSGRRRGGAVALVVDPDESYRKLVKSALEPRWQVSEASSGAEAGILCHAHDLAPDLVLIAEGLSPLSESQLASLIRGAAGHVRAPAPLIWLLSASGAVPDAMKGEFDGAIARILDAESFAAALTKSLGRAGAPSHLRAQGVQAAETAAAAATA